MKPFRQPKPFRCYEDGQPLYGIEVCPRHPDAPKVPWGNAEGYAWERMRIFVKKGGDLADLFKGDDLEVFADGEPWGATRDPNQPIPNNGYGTTPTAPASDAQVANRFRVWNGVLTPFPEPPAPTKRADVVDLAERRKML